MKLSVVIVSYNVCSYLCQCLRSLEEALKGMEAEVIVVDNHSKDDTVATISRRFPWVHIIISRENLGFAKANNKAIRQSHGEYVLMLNPDTFVGEDVLRSAVNFMDSHPRAGALGVRMLRTDGGDAMESRRGIPTPMTAFYKMVGLCSRFPANRHYGRYYMGWLPWDEPCQIDIVSGAFCMLRRSMLDSVGLLDEDFFMYGEDIDLSYRIKKAGWQNWYLPLKILHYKGESTQKSSFRYVHVFYEAMLIFFKKHYGHLSLILSLPIQLGIYLKAFLALMGMQWNRLHKSLGFVKVRSESEPTYLFHCSEASLDRCRQLAERYGLKAEYSTKDARHDAGWGDSGEGGDVCHVFDMSHYSFGSLLEMMSAHHHPGTSFATYYPSEGVLINSDFILRLS